MPDSTDRFGRIVVIGSANMDIIGRVPRLPGEGETVLGSSVLHAPGGKGANQAVAAARAGSPVTFVGRVGGDVYGAELIESLESAGVSTEYLAVDDHPTGVALILVDDEGGNSIAVIPGANSSVSTEDVDRVRDIIAESAILVLQLEIPIETVEYAARVAREVGTTVLLNPAPAAPLESSFLKLFDVIVPNREEVGRLSGVGSPVEPASAAGMLMRSGVHAIVVTLGSEGAVIVTPEDEAPVPAFSVRAIDTTGAGDAFVGNLAHGLAGGQSLRDASRFAAAAAALSVQRPGAQPSMPSQAETTEFLNEHSGP